MLRNVNVLYVLRNMLPDVLRHHRQRHHQQRERTRTCGCTAGGISIGVYRLYRLDYILRRDGEIYLQPIGANPRG